MPVTYPTTHGEWEKHDASRTYYEAAQARLPQLVCHSKKKKKKMKRLELVDVASTALGQR